MNAAFPACHPLKQKEEVIERMTEYVAIDIAKKKCVTCAMNEDGSISETSSYSNSSFEAAAFAKQLVERYGECEAVVESTGNMWIKTYEAFELNGIKIKLANPMKTRAIAEARVKTDKLDAKILAHLLRGDLIAECYVAPKDVRQSRSLLGHRMNIVKEQTKIKNRIHALLDKYDVPEYESKYHLFGTNGMKWLRSLELGGKDDQEILQSLLRQLEFLENEEKIIDSDVAKEAIDSKYVPIIMSMPGFDYYGASLLAAYISNISRFQSPEKLVSWAGLCPSVHQTGESLYMGKMKDGNKKIRWMAIQAAHSAVRCDPRLKAFYEKKLKRHSHNVAITHVANKMLTIIWHMLQQNRLYNEKNEKLYSSKLKRMARTAENGELGE
jgi:transposase